jgi:hypothetical protein
MGISRLFRGDDDNDHNDFGIVQPASPSPTTDQDDENLVPGMARADVDSDSDDEEACCDNRAEKGRNIIIPMEVKEALDSQRPQTMTKGGPGKVRSTMPS